MRKIDKIIIHCSDSFFGDAALIDAWHKERGFSGIGYHYVILLNGVCEDGRPLEMTGAHCKGDNEKSIGICLIGKDSFADEQMVSLKELCLKLMKEYGIKASDIYGHSERPGGKNKTCPNFDVKALREELSSEPLRHSVPPPLSGEA